MQARNPLRKFLKSALGWLRKFLKSTLGWLSDSLVQHDLIHEGVQISNVQGLGWDPWKAHTSFRQALS